MSGTSVAEVEIADSARIAAMLRSDAAQLAAVVHPDAFIVHTNGTAETRSEFLHAFETGARCYQSIHVASREVTIRDGVPVVIGLIDVASTAGNASYQLTAAYTAIYTTESPPRMMAYMATLTPAT